MDIKTYDFKAGLPQEFEILDIEELYHNFDESLTTAHRLEFYNILWFQQGFPTHVVDFQSIEIKPNTLLFLNKDTVQRYDKMTPFGCKAIVFTDSFFCKTDEDIKFLRNSILFNDLFSTSTIHIDKYEPIFARLVEEMIIELENEKDNLQADILKNLLHNFLLHAERKKRKLNFIELKKGKDLDDVMLFKNLLETNYKNQKQVNYYARQILLTEKRLNQACTNIFGKSPKNLIDERVLLEAKRVLAHNTQSVKEIAYYLGFNEPTNFIKFFKKHSKLTPTEFRIKNTLS